MTLYMVTGVNCDGDQIVWWCERECDADACLAMVRHFGGLCRLSRWE